MNFDFRKVKDKRSLLLEYSDEEIMEIMGVPIQEERFSSPFREDRHPSCTLSRGSNNRLYYMDWAVFDKPKDVFETYLYLYGGTFNQAVKGLWEMFETEFPNKLHYKRNNYLYPELKVNAPKIISVESRTWNNKDIRWWKRFGIDSDLLKKYKVNPIQTMWIGNDVIYNHFNTNISSGYWYEFNNNSKKIYFPFNKKKRFYHNDSSTIQGYEQLPEKGRFLLITKSLKDCMLLNRFNIPAVAPQSETVIFNSDILLRLKKRFNHIAVLFDADCAGINGLRKYRKNLHLQVFILKKDWKTKDISDFYVKFGPEVMLELVTKFKEAYLCGRAGFFEFEPFK